MKSIRLWIIVAVLCALTGSAVMGQSNPAGTQQTPELMLDEARLVHLGNLERHARGIPPLRWNRQLTDAARWYSWDSTENRPAGFCGDSGVEDTAGRRPADLARAFGYLGLAGSRNMECRYIKPDDIAQIWRRDPISRINLLSPRVREIGVGYYRRSDGRGYVTLDFGVDPAYAPVVIENEAITTLTPNVNLYIYDRSPGGGFASLGAATHMMISNSPCFTGATWEPYAANRSWTLESGEGWRQVYVKTRDVFGRTLTVSDTIYLGAHAPLDEISPMSSNQAQVTIYNATDGASGAVQLSAGWLADDTFITLWEGGESIDDATALGGSAFRFDAVGAARIWIWATDFIPNLIPNMPMTAYFRLKVNSNTSSGEVARIMVKGGSGRSYGPIRLRGIDFAAPDRYQEFPLDFVFTPSDDDPHLIFEVRRTGDADVTFDAVSIFSAPQPAGQPFIWNFPGGNYRGQGIWLRYVNGNQFSDIVEAITHPVGVRVSPAELTFLAARDGKAPASAFLTVTPGCPDGAWRASSDAPWLRLETSNVGIRVYANQSGLSTGVYTGVVTIVQEGDLPAITIPVRFVVADQLFFAYLPVINR